jgi:hypothetical protein
LFIRPIRLLKRKIQCTLIEFSSFRPPLILSSKGLNQKSIFIYAHTHTLFLSFEHCCRFKI